ncbi:MAG: hypothetical protein K2M64_01615 [Clostridia bacterium]|nr:hypothetical protein [Clostridia bacterium]
MLINLPQNTNVKCDARNCKGTATAYIETKGRNGRLYLCADCLNAIVAERNLTTVPRSSKNTIKRITDEKEKNRNA